MKRIILSAIVLIILVSCAKPSGVENALFIENHIQTSGYAVDFSLTEDYIFIAEDQRGFSIYNRENNEQITQVDSLDDGALIRPFGNVKKISVSQEHNKLFVYDKYGSPGGISIYEISNLDSIDFTFNTTGNTSNIQNMETISVGNYPYLYWTISEQLTYGYYDENDDNGNYFLWEPVGDLDLPNAALGFDLSDSLMIIAAEQYGLYFVDIDIGATQFSDDTNFISTFDLPGEAKDVNIVDNLAFVTLRQDGFAIVDIADINNPQLVHIQEVNEFVYTIDIENDYLVVSSHSGGVLLYNISEISSPQFIGQIDDIGYTYKVAIDGGKIYAATRSGVYTIKIN